MRQRKYQGFVITERERERERESERESKGGERDRESDSYFPNISWRVRGHRQNSSLMTEREQLSVAPQSHRKPAMAFSTQYCFRIHVNRDDVNTEI